MNKQSLRATIAKEFTFLFSLPALIWPLVFLCVPLATILYLSVVSGTVPIISFHKYFQLIDWMHTRIIMRSLILGFGTAVMCLVCAYPIAYFFAIKAGRFKNLFLFLLMIPMWTNFLIQVYGWFFLLEYNGLINTFLLKVGLINEPLYLMNNMVAVFILMIYCYVPFMLMPLYTILEKLNIHLLEASSDLGASPMQTFMRITLPLSMPGIRTGTLLVFVLGFGEFAIPALVGGGKYMMVGSLISYYFLVVRDMGLGAAFTVLSGLVLIFFSFCIYLILGVWCLRDTKEEI